MSVRHRRPISGQNSRKKLLAAFALVTGGFGLGFFDSSANATNHGLFRHSGRGHSTMVAPTGYPILSTSSFTVLSPTLAKTYALSPTVQVMPTTTWTTATSMLMPLDVSCVQSEVVSPAASSTNVPELQEIPKASKPSPSPQEKPPVGSNGSEPPLTAQPVSPPVAPEVPKPALSEKPPAPKVSEVPKLDPKVELPPNLPADTNPLPPAKPAVEKPAKSPEIPANEIKPSASLKPIEKPATAPALKPIEKPAENLVPPPAAEIPLPDTTVPKLEPAEIPPPAKPLAGEGAKSALPGPKDKPPAADASKPTDVPPSGLIELPTLPETKLKPTSAPVIPLPEIPPPADGDLPLPPLSSKPAGQPVQELKADLGRKLAESGVSEKVPGNSAQKRESLRPVISGTSKMTLPKPELGVSVKSKLSGSAERDVRVLFREPKGDKILFDTRTDSAGKAKIELPEGRWEVLVESTNGTLYVLGELISTQGKFTTVSGRSLPNLEINR
jgi:hypothetical protein